MTAHAAPDSVLILGAGLTGLTTAYHLRQQGLRVTVLDHPDWEEGFHSTATEAVPMLFGRHHETWKILRSLDQRALPDADVTVPVEFRLPDGRVVAYRSTHLPGALQWMMSLFKFRGLAWSDRWKLFSHLEQIWEQALTLPVDLENRTADEWLTAVGQSEAARTCIWHPLAQWLTGNALTRLSAALFVRLLSTLFLGQATDAQLTYLNGTIGDRFLSPLRRRLTQLETNVISLNSPPLLRFSQDGVAAVMLADNTVLHASRYVAALSHQKLLALLPDRLLTRYAYFAQLADLTDLSERRVQFTCRAPDRTPRILLFADRPFQQLTMTPLDSQHVDLRLTALEPGATMQWDNAQLGALARTELSALLPALKSDDMLVVDVSRRLSAALSLHPGTALLRPIQQSPIHNLLVAGPWTDTGWPANVESALISARRCAETITHNPV